MAAKGKAAAKTAAEKKGKAAAKTAAEPTPVAAEVLDEPVVDDAPAEAAETPADAALAPDAGMDTPATAEATARGYYKLARDGRIDGDFVCNDCNGHRTRVEEPRCGKCRMPMPPLPE